MKVTVTKTTEYTLGNIDKDMAIEIFTRYDGDIKSWSEDNLNHFSANDDIDIDFEETYLLELRQKHSVEIDEIFIDRVKSLAPQIVDNFNLDGFKLVSLNLKDLKEVSKYMDVNNLERKTSGVYLHDQSMIATDTMKMTCLSSSVKQECPIFIHHSFVKKIIEDGAKLYICTNTSYFDMNIALETKEGIYQDIYGTFKAIDYDRVLLGDNKEKGGYTNVDIADYQDILKKHHIDINEKLSSALNIDEIDSFSFDNRVFPVHFFSKRYEIILMTTI